MSLDQFRTVDGNYEEPSDDDEEVEEDSYSWGCNWHFEPGGYWDNVDEKFFGEDTPNQPPLMAVPEKLAAELHIIDDPDFVEEVGEWWSEREADSYTEVMKIVFNDLSVWHIPLKPWDKDYARVREHHIKQYLPEVIRWQAILDGEDPDQAVKEWEKPWAEWTPKWFSDVGDTEMSESTRKWFNNNARWMPHIDRKVESMGDEVEVELEDEDDDWADDW